MNRKKQQKRGFLLLLAVIIGSILLTISMGIANIAYKELLLAATSRNSVHSFYAADSGMECAMYWDNFRHDGRIQSKFRGEPNSFVECNGQLVEVEDVGAQAYAFDFSLGLVSLPTTPPEDRNPYASVVVEKDVVVMENGLQVIYSSIVLSDGRNNNIPSSRHRVERTLETRVRRNEP